MIHLLLATAFEAKPFLAGMELVEENLYRDEEKQLLITGMGPVQAAISASRYLTQVAAGELLPFICFHFIRP